VIPTVIIIGDGAPVKLLPGESVVLFVGAGTNQFWWNERSAWRARLLRALQARGEESKT